MNPYLYPRIDKYSPLNMLKWIGNILRPDEHNVPISFKKEQTLSKQQKHDAVFGFVRKHFTITKMPISLFGIIFHFYDDIVYWKLTSDEMTAFEEALIDDTIKGPMLSLSLNQKDPITMQCVLYPCGNAYVYRSGFVESYLSITNLSENIEYVIVYMVLSSSNPHYEFKHTVIFRKINDSRCWSCAAVRRIDCMQSKHLEFGYYAKLLYVKYQDDIQRNEYNIEQITMEPHCEYEWKLSGNELKKIKNGKTGQHFYSPNFNGSGCFCLYVSPRGWHAGNTDTFSFQVKLLKLPQEVNCIEMDICLICKELDNFHWVEYDKQMSYTTPRSGWPFGDKYRFSSEKFIKMKSITLKVIMRLKKDQSVFNKMLSPYHIFMPNS